jgi:hypothetical protein
VLIQKKSFILFFLFLLIASIPNPAAGDFFDPPQTSNHGGNGGSGPDGGSSQKDSNYPYNPYYASKPRKCHIICGPNSAQYELHYRCLSGEGRILKEGLNQKVFRICRINENDDISCDANTEPTRFTIFGKDHTHAVATLKEKNLGKFECHGE